MTVKNHHRDPLLLSCKLLLLLVLGRISKRKSENNHVRTAEKKDQKVLANFLLASTVVFCTTIRDLRHNTYFSRLDNTIITNPWEADRTRKFRRGLIFIIHNEFHTHYTYSNKHSVGKSPNKSNIISYNFATLLKSKVKTIGCTIVQCLAWLRCSGTFLAFFRSGQFKFHKGLVHMHSQTSSRDQRYATSSLQHQILPTIHLLF